MYNGNIGKYRFEYEQDTNRIIVYEEGAGVEPIAYINVKINLSEKEFHYEIMDFISKLK